MMWILFVILASFFYALVSLVDKYVLTNVNTRPAVLVFYIGVLGMLVFLLSPFVGFDVPPLPSLLLSAGSGFVFSLALLVFFSKLKIFEASRLVPAVGAFVPLFIFLFVFILSWGRETFSGVELAAFLLLLAGTVLISRKKGTSHTKASLQAALASALLFSVAFIMAKYAYMGQSFWPVFMFMRFGGLAVSLGLLFLQEVRNELLGKGQNGTGISFWEMPGKYLIFLVGQAGGALAEVFRNAALFLVPLSMLPFVNALQGLQHVFLLAFATLLSWKFPHILKEEASKGSLAGKLLAIFLIGGGLALLAL